MFYIILARQDCFVSFNWFSKKFHRLEIGSMETLTEFISNYHFGDANSMRMNSRQNFILIFPFITSSKLAFTFIRQVILVSTKIVFFILSQKEKYSVKISAHGSVCIVLFSKIYRHFLTCNLKNEN